MKWEQIGIWACVVVVLLAIGAGVLYGAWWGISQVPHKILAAYALVMTGLLPAVGYGAYRAAQLGYKLGKVESNAVIDGINLGTGPVVATAEKVANVKIGATRALRQPDPAMIVDLPEVIDVTPKLQSGRKVIL